ncbi:MAG: hypothetical protein J5752_06715 [Clostridiales bacterium]|nr:hypothetical protein [Clostridiales bacterium]
MHRRLTIRAGLVVCLLATAMASVSCGSLDQSLTRITTTTQSSSESETRVTSESQVTRNDSEVASQVTPYLDTLISGDPAKVSDLLVCKPSDVIYPSATFDNEAFSILYKNATYSVGGVVTSDYVDYSVDVTLYFPDIADCFDQVLTDGNFMQDLAKDWVLALKDHTDVDQAKQNMVLGAFEEALRRIEEGTYTEKKVYTGIFKFHANPDSYVCEKYPDFFNLLGISNYIQKYAYVHPRKELDLLSDYTKQYVTSGDITQEEAQLVLTEKMAEITGSQ